MQICFNIDNSMLSTLTSGLEAEGYTCGVDNKVSTGVVDTNLKIFDLVSGITEYTMHILTESELNRFFQIIKGEEVARFNSGKPRLTFIDFKIFEEMDAGVDYINQLDNTKEAYYHEIILTLSEIAFTEEVGFHLNRLQALTYQLSLVLQGILKKKADPIYDLRAFIPMAQVLEFGATKYERNNWRKHTEDPLSSGDSLYRHIMAMIAGEMDDPDSGLPHIGHVMCNVMFLSYHLTKYSYV